MEEKYSTYRGLRIDDTAEWHLVIYISESGISAYLKQIENPLEPIVTMFSKEWKCDDGSLLSNIENAVYDNPQLLDDFSTDVVICSPRSIWVPASVSDDRDSCAVLYNRVYAGNEAEDLFIDDLGEMKNIAYLCSGLAPFLRRTLSGSRIRTQQGILASRLSERGADMPRLYVDLYGDKADMLLFDGRKLLLGATHSWREQNDIVYHVLNIIDVYGLDREKVQVSISGGKGIKTELMKDLRKFMPYVMLTMLPTAVSKTEMPLSAAFAITRISSSNKTQR